MLFAVPGAFTPGCSVRHLPGYIEHLNEFKDKGVDIVIVIAMNDAFVMSAWGKANDIKNDNIVSLSLRKTDTTALANGILDVYVRPWHCVFEEHRLDAWGRQDWEICNLDRPWQSRVCRERAWR